MIERIRNRHKYFDHEDLPPRMVPIRDIIASMQNIEDSISKKSYIIRKKFLEYEEILQEQKRWEKRNMIFSIVDKDISENEEKLDNEILLLRRKRKEAVIDSTYKYKLSEMYRNSIPHLIKFTQELESVPDATYGIKLSNNVVESSADIMEQVKKKLIKKEEKVDKPISPEVKQPEEAGKEPDRKV